jgi:hypothetical protein
MIYRLKKPVKAIWKSKDHDVPITIIKMIKSEFDSSVFYGIEESKTFIPENEVEFLEEF